MYGIALYHILSYFTILYYTEGKLRRVNAEFTVEHVWRKVQATFAYITYHILIYVCVYA